MSPSPKKESLLSDKKGLHLLVLDILCLRTLGPEFIGYEPEALFTEMEIAYGKIGKVTAERLQVCQLLHSNNLFWTEWEAFEKSTASICGEIAVFNQTQPPDPEEITISLLTAQQVASHQYSEEVKRYIAACCIFSGLYCLEGPLSIASPFVFEHYRGKGIEPDVDSVVDLLSRTKIPFKDPDSAEEVQVNKLLSIKAAAADFQQTLERQIKANLR